MSYLAVNELKRSKDVWARLGREREMIITRDGKPCAVLVGVSADTVESDLAEIRRALFGAAVSRVRGRARRSAASLPDVEALVRRSRRERDRV